MTIEILVVTGFNSLQPGFAGTGSTNATARTLRGLRAVSVAEMVLPQTRLPRRQKGSPENRSASNGPSGSVGAERRSFRFAGKTPSPSRLVRLPPRNCPEPALQSRLLRFGTAFLESRQSVGHGPIPAGPGSRCRSRFQRTHGSIRYRPPDKDPQTGSLLLFPSSSEPPKTYDPHPGYGPASHDNAVQKCAEVTMNGETTPHFPTASLEPLWESQSRYTLCRGIRNGTASSSRHLDRRLFLRAPDRKKLSDLLHILVSSAGQVDNDNAFAIHFSRMLDQVGDRMRRFKSRYDPLRPGQLQE